jgi:hypothetical protein
MIYQDLYYETLIRPCEEGANHLKIISGYATSAMAFHHLEELRSNKLDINISLLVGMCPTDGLSVSNHRGFQNIVNSIEYKNKFLCSYIYKTPSVHSKLYIWYKDKAFYKSFIGSANYTQNAFYHQREALAEITDKNILNYYQTLEADSIYCDELEAEDLIRIYNDKNYYRNHMHEEMDNAGIESIPSQNEVENRTISLLSKKMEEVQRVGGLNWGHRDKRNRNEAYIQLPPDVYKSDFFPAKPQHFTVVTDDSKTFICCRAQKGKTGDAIETPHNNALLGEYFRNRLGLPNGAFVTRKDLEHYKRTDVTFYKFDNENYYMDFSVK